MKRSSITSEDPSGFGVIHGVAIFVVLCVIGAFITLAFTNRGQFEPLPYINNGTCTINMCTGAEGAPGVSGPSGFFVSRKYLFFYHLNRPAGRDGDQGPSGETGPSGATGTPGPSGPAGMCLSDPSCMQGPQGIQG